MMRTDKNTIVNSKGEEELPFIKYREQGITLSVTVIPRSSSNSVAGILDGRLKIKLTSPPVDGKANEALINYLSKLLKIKKSSINILKGETSRKKTVLIEGLDKERLLNTLS